MIRTPWRARLLAVVLLVSLATLAGCSGQGGATGGALYVQDLLQKAQAFDGQEVTVDGAYVWRPGDPSLSVLALGVSTLDNGLDAQPLGDPIWVDDFPPEETAYLHRPGDAVYGFVRVRGRFETNGGFGPNGQYKHRLQVVQARPIEQIRRVEHTLRRGSPGEGKLSFFDLQRNPEQYHGQTITTQGYYFWNSLIYVLAEGISTDENGSSPLPIGNPIWMEGFPPEQSAALHIGPNNSYVWGLVEVTGTFETGGGYGRDGAYQSLLTVQQATALEKN